MWYIITCMKSISVSILDMLGPFGLVFCCPVLLVSNTLFCNKVNGIRNRRISHTLNVTELGKDPLNVAAMVTLLPMQKNISAALIRFLVHYPHLYVCYGRQMRCNAQSSCSCKCGKKKNFHSGPADAEYILFSCMPVFACVLSKNEACTTIIYK